MRAVRLAATVVTATVLLAGATACGSKGGGDSKAAADTKDAGSVPAGLTADPKAALTAAALVMQKAGSGKVAMISPDPTSPGGSGTVDWKDPGKVSLDVSSDMEGKKLKIRVIGTDAYVGGDDTTATAALQGKHWVKVPASEEMGGAFVVMGQMTNPVAQLTIAAASGKLSKVGQESVDGVQTTHLRAVEETATLVAGMTALTPEQRQSVQKTLEEDGKTLTIDFWLNDKQELVKYQEYGDTNGESKAVTVKYSDLGQGGKVEAPAAGDLGSQADLLKLFG
ncbi:hypothetical protein [Kitasatospora cathayae]|uniref:Lipoprotein n=1 Tax=Kitasatospora cathayae TaxID=3004092 RepID=A0ABY7Q6Q4_9ACTN|nr:hypothetical protein [Kitasatospora sp. HUAS 3-15]WBP88355.1 hypothetical protein O1G21_22640 [Kitasatospora sp. HUAS 3-15]